MIDCGRLHVPDRHRAVALLEDEDDDPVGRPERDEVQDHGLQRQDQRPERPREQDVGEQDHEAEHVGEVRVDGLDEVAILGGRRRRGDPRSGRRATAGARVLERRDRAAATAWTAPSVERERLDQAVAGLAPRAGATAAVDPGVCSSA